MSNNTITRRTDDLGRIVIPKEIRRAIGIEPGAELELYTVNRNGRTQIIIQKPQRLSEEDWDRAGRIISLAFPAPFALYDDKGFLMYSVGMKNTPIELFGSKETKSDNWYPITNYGYLLTEDKDTSRINRVIKIAVALFEDSITRGEI